MGWQAGWGGWPVGMAGQMGGGPGQVAGRIEWRAGSGGGPGDRRGMDLRSKNVLA